MTNSDYSKISITAKMVAFFRQFSDIPFASEVAEFVRAYEALLEISSKMQVADEPEVADDTQNRGGELPDEVKIFAPFLEARYKSIETLIREAGIDQVLELASGVSLRGLAMCSASDMTYVESDLPGINEEKKRLLEHIFSQGTAKPPRHHVVNVNALNYSELANTLPLFLTDKPLAIVTEGLLNYLSKEERATVAANVRKFLTNFSGGAWITPDFITRQISDDVPEMIKRFRAALTGVTERQLNEAAFENEDAIADFATESGFTMICYSQADLVPELTSVDRMHLSPELVNSLKPRVRVWVLSPQ